MAKSGKITFKLNKAEFRKIMAQQRGATHSAAKKIAGNVKKRLPDGVPVTLQDRTDKNGRPVTLVTVAHASGMARQAKDGILTRSAAEAGMEVKRYD